MGSHIFVAWIWFAFALVNTSISHSGYHMPFLPSPEAHDYHHLTYVITHIHIHTPDEKCALL